MPIRRLFTQDPGVAELLSVGSIVVIDQAPPAVPLGAGTGMAICVGEFEDGPFAVTEITSPAQLVSTFGGLGWQDGTNPYANPVAQQSGGNEAWNGNGYIALSNKTFQRLAIQRVDNSAGSVELTRLACLTGGEGTFAANNGDQITFRVDGVSFSTGQVDAAAAEILASGGVYPLVSPGGQFIILSWDDQDPIKVTLADTDLLLADVIARINGRVAATIASDSAGELLLSSIRLGSRARMQIVGGTPALLAALGLPAAVVLDEWSIVVNADVAASTQLRVSKIVNGLATDYDTVAIPGPVGSVTDKRNAILDALMNLGVSGHTFTASGAATVLVVGDPNEILTPVTGITALAGGADLTINNDVPGVALEVYGTGNVGDSQQITATEAANILDQVANLSSDLDADGALRVCNEATPGTGTLQAFSGALVAAFGFDTSIIADANNGADVTIPAGTRFRDNTANATEWISIEAVATGTGGGPFEIKVRPWFDTDSAIASPASSITSVMSILPDGFAVDNPDPITRLSAAQLDARYITAIRETNVDAPPASQANYIFSARTSRAIRDELTRNCRDATAAGLAGRKCMVRPRIAATVLQAQEVANENRDERKQVVFPSIQTAINEIRQVGSVGGIGFTDDGVIDAGADSFLVAFRTFLNPEQSAAEQPSSTNYGALNAIGLESTYDPGTPGSTKLGVNDYKLFKREGITALRQDREFGLGWNDDVTNSLDIGRTSANRRAMHDFVNDSMFEIATPYKSKIAKPEFKRSLEARYQGFFDTLVSAKQPAASRIEGYLVTEATDPNVPNLIRYQISVRMYATADVIVNQTTVGPTVVVSADAG